MKRRFLSLLFVLAGAVCLAARKAHPSDPSSALVVCGVGSMIAGVVIRLTGRRS